LVGASPRSTAPGSDDGTPATRGVRKELELASAPLRACWVEGLPTGVGGVSDVAAGSARTHRSQVRGFGPRPTEGEENALPGEVRPFVGVLAGRVWQVEVDRRCLARTSRLRLRLGMTDGA